MSFPYSLISNKLKSPLGDLGVIRLNERGRKFAVTQVVLLGKSGEKQVLHPTLVQKILAETKIKNYICIVKLRV